MRIIGGSAARRILKAPAGLAVRPTPDRVKQAIFNSLAGRVNGATVLELYAGSGSLGLECLSRGAARLVAVEKSDRHARFIRDNLVQTGISPALLDMRTQEVQPALAQLAASGMRFDLILADPPYGPKNVGKRSTSEAQKLLDDPNLPKLLHPGGIFILGHTKRDTLTLTASWVERKLMKHGDTCMRFLELPRAGENSEPLTDAVLEPVVEVTEQQESDSQAEETDNPVR